MYEVFHAMTGRTVLAVRWRWLARLVARARRGWDLARQGEGW